MGVKGRIIHKLPHRKKSVPIKNISHDTNIRNIFFDLDDTIIKTQERYDKATRQCLDILQEEFGLSTKERWNMRWYFKTQDAKRAVESKKFSIHRFTYAWLDVYEKYCRDNKKEVSAETKKKLKQITQNVWTPPFETYDGVIETIKLLKTEFPVAKINILTLGDPSVQQEKIKDLPEELKNHIDCIFVVENKSTKTFERILKGLNKERCLMVGNSEKSDIAPALEVGIKAVHIPNRTWQMEKQKIDKKHKNFLRAESIEEIPEILKEI